MMLDTKKHAAMLRFLERRRPQALTGPVPSRGTTRPCHAGHGGSVPRAGVGGAPAAP